MTNPHKKNVDKLISKINIFSEKSGSKISQEVEKKSTLLLHWIKYLNAHHLTGSADYLISSVAPSLREVAATLSLGITRPAIFSLRSQIDLVLTWLYFKDHPIELEYVNSTSDGFKMKKDLIIYLSTYYEPFGHRFGILKLIKKRKFEEPYRFLSAHIHGQSSVVLCNTTEFHEVVRSQEECEEHITAVYEVTEYLNDVLLAVYADNWASLPTEIRVAAEARFSTAIQKADFFTANKPNKPIK